MVPLLVQMVRNCFVFCVFFMHFVFFKIAGSIVKSEMNQNTNNIVKKEKESSLNVGISIKREKDVITNGNKSSRKRYRSEFEQEKTDLDEIGLESQPSKKRSKRSISSSDKVSNVNESNNGIVGYIMRFFVTRDGLDGYNRKQMNEFNKFLTTNLTKNLLKIPEQTIKWLTLKKTNEKYLKSNKLGKDLYLCEIMFEDKEFNNKSMKELLEELKEMLTKWDFTSWKISIVDPKLANLENMESCWIVAATEKTGLHRNTNDDKNEKENERKKGKSKHFSSSSKKSSKHVHSSRTRKTSEREFDTHRERERERDRDRDRDRDKNRDRRERRERKSSKHGSSGKTSRSSRHRDR